MSLDEWEATRQKFRVVMVEVADWYAEHQRKAEDAELRPILTKYFHEESPDLKEFEAYMDSPEGAEECTRLLKTRQIHRIMRGGG